MRAAAGQGSMYHHFSGKPSLAAAALAESGAALLATAEESMGTTGPAFDRIVHYLRRERPILRGCPIGRMTEDAEVIASPELRAPIEETLLRLRNRVAQVVEEGQQSGEFDTSMSPQRIAATVIATVQGGYVIAKAAQDEQLFDDAIEGLVDLLRSILAPANARNN